MKRVLFVLLAVFFSMQAHAEIIMIGDVDAPNTDIRPQNYDLLENVRNGATDIAWLTGGYAVNSRYTDLRSRWTTAGATITDDLTTSVGIPLTDRGLVVVSQLYANLSLFDASAISDIATYLAAGGEVLYIAQVSQPVHRDSYNEFLTSIGSTMQFTTAYGERGTEVIDTNTPYGQGVSAFELSGWNPISGGIPVVTLNNEIGVAYGTGSVPIVGSEAPVPTMSTYGLLLTVLIVLLLGGLALTRNNRFHSR